MEGSCSASDLPTGMGHVQAVLWQLHHHDFCCQMELASPVPVPLMRDKRDELPKNPQPLPL